MTELLSLIFFSRRLFTSSFFLMTWLAPKFFSVFFYSYLSHWPNFKLALFKEKPCPCTVILYGCSCSFSVFETQREVRLLFISEKLNFSLLTLKKEKKEISGFIFRKQGRLRSTSSWNVRKRKKRERSTLKIVVLSAEVTVP